MAFIGKKRTRYVSKKRQSRTASLFIVCATIALCVICFAKVADMRAESRALAKTEASLEQQIQEQRAEAKAIEARREYMETDQYIEDVAKEQLGLVYPNEVVLKPKE